MSARWAAVVEKKASVARGREDETSGSDEIDENNEREKKTSDGVSWVDAQAGRLGPLACDCDQQVEAAQDVAGGIWVWDAEAVCAAEMYER